MNVRKIMCAVDLSEDSKPIATYTAKMAKALGAKVLVIYAAPSLSQYVGFHVPPNTIETFVDEIISGADENMKAFVEERDCVACGCCVKVCPLGAISVRRGVAAQVDVEKCVGCGKCARECPASVISIQEVQV